MKRMLLGALLGAAIVAAGAGVYAFLFLRGDDSPRWILASYSGDVQVSLSGQAFAVAELKMQVHDGDRIHTGVDGEVTLVHGDSHVTLRPRSDLSVAGLNAEWSKFDVAQGSLIVEARGDRVSMTSLAGPRVDASDAGLGMSVGKDGLVALQVNRGSADFTAMGATEIVNEGEESHASPGQRPTKPVKIPRSVLLNVRFPDAATFNARIARVEGRTSPGNRVLVGGRMVDVDSSGHFEADVELPEGLTRIEVEAHDPLGRTGNADSGTIRVDTTAPALTGAAIGTHRVGGR